MLLMSLLPAIIESLVTSAMARGLFDMPENDSYALGFMLSNLGTGVALPSVYALYLRGFKFKKELPNTIVVASTFDNIMTACMFTIFNSCVFEKVSTNNQIIGHVVGKVFIGIAAGIAVGIGLYLVTLLFKFVKNDIWRSRLYFTYFIAMAVGVPLGS